MHTRGYETAVDIAVVPAQASHQGKLLTYLIRILSIETRRGLITVEVVMIQTNTRRETVVLIEVGLEQQRGIAVALVGIILSMPIEGVLVVQRTRKDQGNV